MFPMSTILLERRGQGVGYGSSTCSPCRVQPTRIVDCARHGVGNHRHSPSDAGRQLSDDIRRRPGPERPVRHRARSVVRRCTGQFPPFDAAGGHQAGSPAGPCLGLAVLLGIDHHFTTAAVVCAAAPIAKTAYILASEHHCEGPLVASTISLTTLLSTASLVVWLSILPKII
jgi:hypothetical protein